MDYSVMTQTVDTDTMDADGHWLMVETAAYTVVVDKGSQGQVDLNEQGEPLFTKKALIEFIRELYSLGTYGDETRDRLLAQAADLEA